MQRFLEIYSRPSLTWDDLAVPARAHEAADPAQGHPAPRRRAPRGRRGRSTAIVVSNHGGRQVDGAIATLDALPGVVEAVDGRVPVLLDCGVRSGADVFKALALGATRGAARAARYVYGLAIAGEAGVREVIANFMADFDLTMGLAGCRSVSDITSEKLVPGVNDRQ